MTVVFAGVQGNIMGLVFKLLSVLHTQNVISMRKKKKYDKKHNPSPYSRKLGGRYSPTGMVIALANFLKVPPCNDDSKTTIGRSHIERLSAN